MMKQSIKSITAERCSNDSYIKRLLMPYFPILHKIQKLYSMNFDDFLYSLGAAYEKYGIN